jgi:aromatase
MSVPDTRRAEHQIEVLAPAEVIYQLIADVANWPQVFPPTVHVEYLERGVAEERIQIWATANGTAKTWISRRALDPGELRIEFRQEVSQPPVGAMSGTWVIERISAGESLVRLLHEYRSVHDDPDELAWIHDAVDHNSQAELASLKANAEQAVMAGELTLTFDDSVQINGSGADVYDFINEAQLWEDRLSHVDKVSLREETPGLQVLEMDTRTKDGSVHTTKSVRVCFPYNKIVYKQIQVPALMTLHTGHWLLVENSHGVLATSRHTVMINTTNIAKVLGAEAGVEEAKKFVHTALTTNSLATLGYAKDYAEARQ